MQPSAPDLETRLREGLPLLFALVLVTIDLTPRPAPAGGGIAPFLTLGAVYFWGVYRPDLMSNAAVFAIGLVYDVLSGLPLGCSSVALLLGRAVMVARHRFFYAKSFVVIWALFVVWAPAVELVRYAFTAASLGVLVDPLPLVAQCGLTIALYPALSWVLVRLHEQVRTRAYAEP